VVALAVLLLQHLRIVRVSPYARWRGTYCQPLSVVNLVRREQGTKRVVAGNDESSNVDKELSGDVEEDQEEVEAGETEDHVNLGD